MAQKVLILGGSGQVGHELARTCPKSYNLKIADQNPDQLDQPAVACDLTDIAGLTQLLSKEQPDVIINAAAYTAVDKAESEKDLAHAVNATALEVLGESTAQHPQRFLVHYSTDYVFDGTGDAPRSETAATNPLSVYGRSKLAGELALKASCPDQHATLRTSWVFSAHGHNFVKTMLRLAKEKDSLNIVNDQMGAPTSARLLADATWHMLAFKDGTVLRQNNGLFHVTSRGETSWHGFAEAIFSGARSRGVTLAIQTVGAIPSEDYPVPAPRPKNSRLDCQKFEEVFQYRLAPWQDELSLVLDELVGKLPSEMPAQG